MILRIYFMAMLAGLLAVTRPLYAGDQLEQQRAQEQQQALYDAVKQRQGLLKQQQQSLRDQMQQRLVAQQRAAYEQAVKNQAVQKANIQNALKQQIYSGSKQLQTYQSSVQQQIYSNTQQQRRYLEKGLKPPERRSYSPPPPPAPRQRPTPPPRQPEAFVVDSQPNNISTKSADTDVVDMGYIWQQLENSSEIWSRIDDIGPKELTVSRYIDAYRQRGVTIRKSTSHYVRMIDSVIQESPELLGNSFKNIMRFVAILEYDFDNGVESDLMAKTVLGAEAYKQNRRRLGLE